MPRMSQYRQEYASIWNNPAIEIDRKPFLWKSCLEGNLNKIADLCKDGVFLSFQEMKRLGQKKKGHFWQYIRLRGCIGERGIKPKEGEI